MALSMLWASPADFVRPWVLTRRISDRRRGDWAAFLGGRVDPVHDGATVRWIETGTLHTAQGAFVARRVYLWRADPGGVMTYFEDGRPFHPIARARRPRAHHDCPPDTYHGAYDFSRWPDWRATWIVGGPRKDYVMYSRYLPA